MPKVKNDLDSDSGSEKEAHVSAAASEDENEEEEEYVVEKVVDKRITKSGKVCASCVYLTSAS